MSDLACSGVSNTNLDDLLNKIDGEFKDGVCNVEGVRHWLENYRSQKCDWEKYAFSNPAEGYSRNLVVEKPGMYTALILCWQPLKGSKIHAHSGSDCFLKILQGSLKEEQFEWPTHAGSPLKLKQEKVYHVDQLNHMTDEKGLHRVTNNDDNEVGVSLHIYMPPFKTCKWFHEDNSKEEEAIMTFASIGGKPTGDYNALARQCTEQCTKQCAKQCTPTEQCTKQCAKQCTPTEQCTKQCAKQCTPTEQCTKQCAKQCTPTEQCNKQCTKQCPKQSTKQYQYVCQEIKSCHQSRQ